MKVIVLAFGLSAVITPVTAAQYVATGDWAPTRKEACDQATALAVARTSAPLTNSSCICDKGDKRFSCLATIDVAETTVANAAAATQSSQVLAQEGAAALTKPAAAGSSAQP